MFIDHNTFEPRRPLKIVIIDNVLICIINIIFKNTLEIRQTMFFMFSIKTWWRRGGRQLLGRSKQFCKVRYIQNMQIDFVVSRVKWR